jgi:hypothetical protein
VLEHEDQIIRTPTRKSDIAGSDADVVAKRLARQRSRPRSTG